MKYAVLLLALMFAGVATPSMAQKVDTTGPVPQKLTFEFEGHTIEVAEKDFPKPMNWDDAMAACQNLGNGWRLPSIDELMAIYKQLHTKGKGNFRTNVWYWSGEKSTKWTAWKFNFEDGGGDSNKDDTRHVRAVRTLP